MKFYVSEKEMERLKTLSGMRFMTVPNHTKLTALGVKIQQPKELVFGDLELQEDKMVLKEILGGSPHTHQPSVLKYPQNDKNKLRCYKRHKIFVLEAL